MEKNFFYFFIFFISLNPSFFGQVINSKKADKLFANKQFIEAAKEYERIGKSLKTLSNLADCYYYKNQNTAAIQVYNTLFQTFKDSIQLETYFKAAHSYMKMGDYNKADPLMSNYLNNAVLSNDFIYGLKSLVPFNYDIQLMTKSNVNHNYGMVSFGEKKVFASAKNEAVNSGGMTNAPNYDFFVADVNKAGLIFQSQVFSNELNTKFHESSPTFSSDGQTLFFCRSINKDIRIDDENLEAKAIYKAELKNGVWTNIKILPFCKKGFSYDSPMITKDGKRLFFSSNNSESLGGFDIFYIPLLKDGNYGIMKNAGNQVNTVHDEKFPFIDNESMLYFSSNGHQGMGGLDIFSSMFLENNFQNVINLGSTINSNLDDFSYVVDSNFDQGFLTSNREGQNNLYSFKRQKNEMNYFIQGSIIDRNTKKPIPNAKVKLIDSKGNELLKFESSSVTEFLFKIIPNSNYTLKASSNGFYPFETEINIPEGKNLRFHIELFKILE